MSEATVGIGSNLGDRLDYLNRAIGALSRLPETRVASCSHVYETDPVGFADQPKYLNAAVLIETKLPPLALLGSCLGIEAALGRLRTFANAPRTIDMDLLFYGDEKIKSHDLTLPHPRMSERAFVLVPLLDLFSPETEPARKFSVILGKIGTTGVKKTKLTLLYP